MSLASISDLPPLIMPTSKSTFTNERPATVYLHTGIGGAGNYHKYNKGTNDLAVSSSSAHSRQHQRSRFPRSLQSFFCSGIGGAGNLHPISASSSLTAAEETARAKARDSHSRLNWFVGIGGIGNRIRNRQEPTKESLEEESESEYSEKALPLGAAEVIKTRVREKLLAKGRV